MYTIAQICRERERVSKNSLLCDTDARGSNSSTLRSPFKNERLRRYSLLNEDMEAYNLSKKTPDLTAGTDACEHVSCSGGAREHPVPASALHGDELLAYVWGCRGVGTTLPHLRFVSSGGRPVALSFQLPGSSFAMETRHVIYDLTSPALFFFKLDAEPQVPVELDVPHHSQKKQPVILRY